MAYEDTLKTLEGLYSLAEGRDDSVFSPQQKGWISRLHREEFGEPVRECGCKNKYTDAVTQLYLKLRRRGQTEEESKYHLRAGVIVWIGTECYSRHNITDAIAKEYLEKHPEDAQLFDISE